MDCIATSVVDFDEVKQEVKKESKKGVKEAAPRMKTRNKMANPSLYSYVSYLPVLSRFWCIYTVVLGASFVSIPSTAEATCSWKL